MSKIELHFLKSWNLAQWNFLFKDRSVSNLELPLRQPWLLNDRGFLSQADFDQLITSQLIVSQRWYTEYFCIICIIIMNFNDLESEKNKIHFKTSGERLEYVLLGYVRGISLLLIQYKRWNSYFDRARPPNSDSRQYRGRYFFLKTCLILFSYQSGFHIFKFLKYQKWSHLTYQKN